MVLEAGKSKGMAPEFVESFLTVSYHDGAHHMVRRSKSARAHFYNKATPTIIH
jgi:hypothetical protein